MRKDTNYPSEWQRTTFEDVAHYINGYAFKPEDWGSVGLPIIRIAQINNPETDHAYYGGPIADDYVIEDGDLLFSWSATLTTLIWNRGPALLNQHIFKVIPQEGVDLHFLHHLIDYKIEDLARQSHGSTMKHIKKSDLLPFPLVIPPLPEQRRIAEILDTADAAIRETERVIAKLRQVKQGLLHDLLTRGLDAHGHLRDPEVHPEQFKDSPLGRIPRGWEIVTIDDIAVHVVDCPHTTPTYKDEGVLVARTSEIREGDFRLQEAAHVSEKEYHERIARLEPQTGDIIFTREAPVGEAFVIPEGMKICLGQRTMVLRPKQDEIISSYLLGQIYSPRTQERFQELVGGTTNPHLNVGTVRSFRIPTPSISEQHRIAAVLDAHDARIRAEEAVLAKRRQVKRGLMDDLLTGRVRV